MKKPESKNKCSFSEVDENDIRICCLPGEYRIKCIDSDYCPIWGG